MQHYTTATIYAKQQQKTKENRSFCALHDRVNGVWKSRTDPLPSHSMRTAQFVYAVDGRHISHLPLAEERVSGVPPVRLIIVIHFVLDR